MIETMKPLAGKVLTACDPVEPQALGRVLVIRPPR
jgi:hypothetical protein